MKVKGRRNVDDGEGEMIEDIKEGRHVRKDMTDS